METSTNTVITVETMVKASVEKVWNAWTDPGHITKWCAASDDWHAPYASNDVKVGGKFSTTMAAKDGSFSFDFQGVYTEVDVNSVLAYDIEDGRKVRIVFTRMGEETKITESFEAEGLNPVEMQRAGWQAILDNFRKYVESLEA